jgi:hypothetical protein
VADINKWHSKKESKTKVIEERHGIPQTKSL